MNPGNPLAFPGMMTPIWYPPIHLKWILTSLVVFAGAVANKFGPKVHSVFLHPAGFFFTLLTALGFYQVGFPPMTFAILFFLLSLWASQSTNEGFLCGANTIDWVVNDKRWWVERVLKERPLGIQEKDVATYPISD